MQFYFNDDTLNNSFKRKKNTIPYKGVAKVTQRQLLMKAIKYLYR